jgi:hypothetical protein
MREQHPSDCEYDLSLINNYAVGTKTMFSMLVACTHRPKGKIETLRVTSAFVLKDIINGIVQQIHLGQTTIQLKAYFRDGEPLLLEVRNGCIVGSMDAWLPDFANEFISNWEDIRKDSQSGAFITTGKDNPSLGEFIATACYMRNYENDCSDDMLTEAKSC